MCRYVETVRAAYLGPGTQHVDRDELLRRARSGEVIVLDVRPHAEYAAGDIPSPASRVARCWSMPPRSMPLTMPPGARSAHR
ncbi:hypothetical protein [Actinophytocola sp.]|jgi:hypothetical protein|uniref:hypothetical protein n=1 Tax=Actinophytocola sp. TaxID=1872138 RepID=UPI002ED942F9